jgi:hypothetical protein
VNIRVSLKASERFTEGRSGAQRDSLAESMGPFGKPKQRRPVSQ